MASRCGERGGSHAFLCAFLPSPALYAQSPQSDLLRGEQGIQSASISNGRAPAGPVLVPPEVLPQPVAAPGAARQLAPITRVDLQDLAGPSVESRAKPVEEFTLDAHGKAQALAKVDLLTVCTVSPRIETASRPVSLALSRAAISQEEEMADEF